MGSVNKQEEKTDLTVGSQENLKRAEPRGKSDGSSVDGEDFGPGRASSLSPSANMEKPQNGDNTLLGFHMDSSSMAAPFTIALAFQSPKKACKKKKDQHGHLKMLKQGRKTLNKANRDTSNGSLKEDGQLEGMDVVMESCEAGEKCKVPTPLIVVSPLTENVKKQKVEGEVQVLS